MSNQISNQNDTPLLSVRNLQVEFANQNGTIKAVGQVNFDLWQGETLAIVGESGSGKSTTAHAIINLLPGTGRIAAGSVVFDGEELVGANDQQMQSIRGRKIGFVPQDPMNNLNPVWSIGFQVEEAIKANSELTDKTQIRKAAIDALQMAGLADAEQRLKQYPHQFSGGMRQRVLIAQAFSLNPHVIIADEPTTALDVTVQKQVLRLIRDMQREHKTTLLFVTHDLNPRAMSRRVQGFVQAQSWFQDLMPIRIG